MESLEQRQIRLESDSVDRGQERLKRALKNAPADETKGGSFLIRSAVPSLTEAIRREQTAIEGGKNPKHAVPFLAIDAEKLAFITLKCAFYLIGAAKKTEPGAAVTRVSRFIGHWCQNQNTFDKLRGRERNIYNS